MINWLEASGLERDHSGTPEALRWLLIRPNGTMTVRRSDNRIAYFRDPGLWWQWRLDRDIHREIDPFTRGPWRPITWSLAIRTARHGMVVIARFNHDRQDNPTATAMLGAVGIDYWVRGSAAWLGEREPASGLHRDLNDSQLRDLRTIAAHCRRRLLTGPNPSDPGGQHVPPTLHPPDTTHAHTQPGSEKRRNDD